MPICIECKNDFNRYVKIDGVEKTLGKNRKRCLNCSPPQNQNQGNLVDNHNGDIKEGERSCKRCFRVFKINSNYSSIFCAPCRANDRKVKMVRACHDYLGGKCIKCGYDKCTWSLHFHHRDPSTKLFNINSGHNKKWEEIRKELDKCDLLCSNCHGEVHYNKYYDKMSDSIDNIKKKLEQEWFGEDDYRKSIYHR